VPTEPVGPGADPVVPFAAGEDDSVFGFADEVDLAVEALHATLVTAAGVHKVLEPHPGLMDVGRESCEPGFVVGGPVEAPADEPGFGGDGGAPVGLAVVDDPELFGPVEEGGEGWFPGVVLVGDVFTPA
jgi:hypothetical protein